MKTRCLAFGLLGLICGVAALAQSTDSNGPTGSTSRSSETQAITVRLEHPDYVQPGQHYRVTAIFKPETEVVRTEIYVNQVLVRNAPNGSRYKGDFEQTGLAREIPVLAVAIDRSGHRIEARGTINVYLPHFIYGQVLADATSYPLVGIPVIVTTPHGQTVLVTDDVGRYQAYVYGYPVDVVTGGDYVAIQRHMPSHRDSWRVPDLRLTPFADPRPAGALTAGNNQLELSGFDGDVQVTALSAQGIAELLPLGYAPLAAFNLAGASGQGRIDWRLAKRPLFDPAAPVAVLERRGRAWRVRTVGHAATRTRLTAAGNGDYLLAVLDRRPAQLPAVGSLVQREDDLVVPSKLLERSLTQPACVSILGDPQAPFRCKVRTAGLLLSGARAQVRVDELHERVNKTLRLPTYDLDFFVYSVGFSARAKPRALGGFLGIRAREPVEPEHTERAEITFTRRDVEVEQAIFMESPRWDLGNLTIEYSQKASRPLAIFAKRTSVAFDNPPHTRVIAAFSLEIGGTLPHAPQLRVTAPGSTDVLLLRVRDDGRECDYVDRLNRDGDTWVNDPVESGMRQSGRFLLLALDYPISEVSGWVRYQSKAVAGAELYMPRLAWRTQSAKDGSFSIALPMEPESRALLAQHDGLRREGQVLLAPTADKIYICNIVIELGNRDFRLLHHNPLVDQHHVDFLPSLNLEFNRPVSDDLALLAAHLRLIGPDGEIPLELVVQPGRYVLNALPKRALSPQTQYHFRADTGLLSLDGDPLSQAVDFAFTTRVPAVTRRLDLSAFTLSWEYGRMFLIAPAEAYVNGTLLRVYNPDNGAGLDASLGPGNYRAEVNARPGDAIELRAIDPAGNSFQRTIDLTRVAPDTYLLGTRPFALRINQDVVLRVDEILKGAGTELLIREAPSVTITETVNQMRGLPTLTPVQSLEFRVRRGAMPHFKARLQHNRDLAEFNNRALVIASFQSGIIAPAEHDIAKVPIPHTIMRMYEAFNVADGAPTLAPGAKRVARSDKFSRSGTMTPIEIGSTPGLLPSEPVGPSVFLSIMATRASLDASHHPVINHVACSRRQFELDRPMNSPPLESRPWHPSLADGFYPAPGIPVYEDYSEKGSRPIYELRGISDAGGSAECLQFGTYLDLIGDDPDTHQAKVNDLTSDNASQFTGFSLLTHVDRTLEFDNEKWSIDHGGLPPPQLKTRWEVGSLVCGTFVLDPERSQRLHDERKVQSAMKLRLTVQSSQALSTYSEPKLYLTGSCPSGKPKIEGNTVTWYLDPVVLAESRLVEATIKIITLLGGENQINDRFVVVGDGPSTEIVRCAPFVLSTNPANETTKVHLDALTVVFSEPVHRIDSSRVELQDEGGRTVDVTFRDESGVEIADANVETALLRIVPARGLRRDETYRLRIDGVVDREGQALEEPIEIHFKTAPFDVADTLDVAYHTQVTGVRNLTLVLTENWRQSSACLDLYDVRDPSQPMKLIGSNLLLKGADDAFLRLALFTPQDLRETSAGIYAPSADPVAFDDLPRGSILVLTRQRFPDDVAHLDLYRYKGGSFEYLFGFDSPEPGLIYDTAMMGRYLILAHKLLGSYESFASATVVVLDLKKLLDEYQHVLAEGSREGRLRFEAGALNFAVVAKYALPGNVSSVSSFVRNVFEGGLITRKPAFLASGYEHPAVYDFNLNRQPPRFDTAMSSSDPHYDARLVVRTPYLHGKTALRLDNGALSGFTYRDPVRGLREIDLAMFMERHGDGQIHFYEIPRSGDTSEQSIVPLKTLEFPAGLFCFAVDPGTGLLAVQGLDHKFSVLDIKAFLETEAGSDSPAFAHPAFISHPIARNFQQLTFIEGNLYGLDNQSLQLVRMPFKP